MLNSFKLGKEKARLKATSDFLIQLLGSHVLIECSACGSRISSSIKCSSQLSTSILKRHFWSNSLCDTIIHMRSSLSCQKFLFPPLKPILLTLDSFFSIMCNLFSALKNLTGRSFPKYNFFQMSKLLFLEGIRGLAALWMVVIHWAPDITQSVFIHQMELLASFFLSVIL